LDKSLPESPAAASAGSKEPLVPPPVLLQRPRAMLVPRALIYPRFDENSRSS